MTSYDKIVSALDSGQSGAILETAKQLENRARRAEKKVRELKQFLKSAQQDLIDGDFEWLIADIDKVLGGRGK